MNIKSRNRSKVNAFVKFAVAFILVLFLIASIKMNIDINNMKTKVAQAEIALENKKLEIEKTKAEINSFELNEETIKKIAREKLGLRDNDAIIFENSQPN